MIAVFRLTIASLLLVTSLFAQAFALETKARAALVLDFRTGTVLLEKNADKSLPPASMSKLMTLNMVFEALEDGRLSLDEELPVSKHAMSYGGSTMFLNTRDRVKVEDLIRGAIVLSGNDACAVLAEALAGSETEFARSMTARAKQLGMMNSTFANSNGWPHPNQRMSARDLVILAERLIREFPLYYGYFAETEFAFDNRSPSNRYNRNPLLKLGIGADGLKTGHTSEAGFGVVGSAEKNGRRIVLMITGLDSAEERALEAEKLVNWAFRQFVEKKILSTGEKVGKADVWLGRQQSVELEVAQDLTLLLPASAAKQVKAEIVFKQPIEAPIEKGQQLGVMKISVPNMAGAEVPLLAASSVEKSGFLSKFKLAASLMAKGLMDFVN
jgi:serine-type D-Ala-D-Ala carboxypeptidase (penicillin-binding protein 5/6)